MNTNNVKKYAPKARKAFIEVMSKQAAKYGVTKKKIEAADQKGDLVLIGERPFSASIMKSRERLVKRVEEQGFDQVMEHVAYSWFNRLCAIRYMERKGFLDHGRRVLSAADGSAGVPQILEECLDIELPGLDHARVRDLKLDGTKDEELYRELLLAQCHALHQAMPFLFEAVADESELLLPENLTKTDSLIRDLVASIPDEDWDHIEIIGWLYQFYISEKKDQVMGKVVKSEDIPAATQLFTPNWIVQYLVQNTVGRHWLQTYPDSPLKEKMPYYIEPAEQTPEVQAQLTAMTPKELKPETLSCIDPAVGSGHLLIEAYKLFKAIYEERGYRTRDIPQLILENNLFGLDIDDRAGQLAGFALMMLARKDDRRIFTRNIRLNVLSLQESSNINLPSLWQSLNLTGEWKSGTSQALFEEEQHDLSAFAADNRYQLLQRTLDRFKLAKTLGSLIDIPHEDFEGLQDLYTALVELEKSGDSMQKAAAMDLLPYIQEALLLAKRYDAVVANPPYMGHKAVNTVLKDYIVNNFPYDKADIFSVCANRFDQLANNLGYVAYMTPFTWMFLKSFENMRNNIAKNNTLLSLLEPEYHAFFDSAFVPICAFSYRKTHVNNYKTSFIRLTDFYGMEEQAKKTIEASRDLKCKWRYHVSCELFESIPGFPFAYHIGEELINSFRVGVSIENLGKAVKGLDTCDNDRFVRAWSEVSFNNIGFDCNDSKETSELACKWYPYSKGGAFRKWYGNYEYVVNWKFDGEELKNFRDENGKLKSRPQSTNRYFKEGITFGAITSSDFSCRYMEKSIFGGGGNAIFVSEPKYVMGLLNSFISKKLTKALNPTLNMLVGDLLKIPVIESKEQSSVIDNVDALIDLQKADWDLYETSWNFNGVGITDQHSVKEWHEYRVITKRNIIHEVARREAINDEVFSKIYGYECFNNSELEKDVSLDQEHSPTLQLISYSLGCIMGRYSLDRESLVYAHSGNEGFTELVGRGAYQTFPADDDGIIPLTDQEWFLDDATNRFREFVKVVWGEEHLQVNIDFVAESLCLHAIKLKKSESAMDTIRRYLSTQFYKDHLKTYKKRPIYWLFSSGKQKAFECLVYLHRYNEGTLSRMRTEYVIPLTAKMATYVQKLENDKDVSGSAAEVKRIEKEITQLHKQQAELSEFDEKLRHYADQRIGLDLDDGVKVNYGKFGDLLAEVKAITGNVPEVM